MRFTEYLNPSLHFNKLRFRLRQLFFHLRGNRFYLRQKLGKLQRAHRNFLVNYVHYRLEFVLQSIKHNFHKIHNKNTKISKFLKKPSPEIPISLLCCQLIHILLEQLSSRLKQMLVPDPVPDSPTGRIFIILLGKLILNSVQIQAAKMHEAGTWLEEAF
jgi:hypothetical protein